MQREKLRVFLHSSSSVFRHWVETSLSDVGVRVYDKVRGKISSSELEPGFFNCLVTTDYVEEKKFQRIIRIDQNRGLETLQSCLLGLILAQLPEFWDTLIAPNKPRSDAVVFLGLSTGGPQALEKILTEIKLAPNTIYIIAQHMPAGQTRGLVDHLQRRGIIIREVEHLKPLQSGSWYVLPSGMHSFFGTDSSNNPLFYQSAFPETIHKPKIDISLYTVALAYRKKLLAGILTGMGNDGAQALLSSRRFGSETFAESKNTALIFGMPKAALEFGATEVALDQGDIPKHINNWANSVKRNSDVA